MGKTKKNKIKTINIKPKSNSKNKNIKNKNVFKLDDFSSNDGFLTTVWGPLLWTFLHTMSFNYPIKPTQQDKIKYKQFILNLEHILPCKHCRINLKTNFKHLPLKNSDMKDRGTFSLYIYNLHELVNKMLKKKSGLKYCDVRERYEHFRSRCTEKIPKVFKFKKEKQTKKNKKEKGCTEPLYGNKSKCVIKIVPQQEKTKTFSVDKTCIKHR